MERISLVDQNKENIGTNLELLARRYSLEDNDGEYAQLLLELHPYAVLVHLKFTRKSISVFRKTKQAAWDFVNSFLRDELKYKCFYLCASNDKMIKVFVGDKATAVGEHAGELIWRVDF